ncbi:hypothetical protein MNBD_GAMMA15-2254 [hydrothermal vent metagenome]|uniref:DUF3619 family protein n=1 Tax=hydrothermal vent metagenome TaxID=652676 RepID=A0A3B0YI75_9ZZZZ
MSDDKQFVEKVRKTLDDSAEAIDDITAARLAAARRNALDARPQRSHWLPAAAFSAVAASALTVALLLNQGSDLPGIDADALELAAQPEDMELIEELDFYDWLDSTQANS